MSALASQMTPASWVFTPPFIQAQMKENVKAVPCHWPMWGEFTSDRWNPRTKGQQRGKCFHLMTSSWFRRWVAFEIVSIMRCEKKTDRLRWMHVITTTTKKQNFERNYSMYISLSPLSLDKMAAILTDDNSKCIFLNEDDRIPICNFTGMCSQRFHRQ